MIVLFQDTATIKKIIPAILRACNKMRVKGRARHSVRAGLCQPDDGAHGVTRPTSHNQKFILIQTLSVFLVITQVHAAPPDERDRQVMDALLQHLLTDSKFNMTLVPTNAATIVLDARTPEERGFVMYHQIRSEIGGRTLPDDAVSDMLKRNTPADAKPDTYDSVAAFYTNLTFGSRIVVTNLAEVSKGRGSLFKDAHPKARGWLEAFLPGYSKNGTRAVVRAGVGPWAHGAMLTAVLEKRGDKWTVVWYHVARFA